MKAIKFIGILAAASFLFSFNAYAQEDANRGADGEVVRGPYVTNGAFDNMFIGLGAGVNSVVEKQFGLGKIGVATDVSWPIVQQVLTTTDAPESASSLSDETQFMASHLDLRQISQWSFIQNTDYGDLANKLAEKISFIDIQSDSTPSMMHLSIRVSPVK